MDKFHDAAPAYAPVDPRKPWNPGFVARLPWLGLGSWIGSLLGVAASVAVLLISNGQPITKWSIQPTVYLAIASAVTNILLHFALAEGANIAWWKRSMKDNTTVNDLHRYWIHGNSLWAASTSGRHINLVAVATIFVAFTPINGPLLQRASTVTFRSISEHVTLSIPIAKELPDGYTGMISGRQQQPSLLMLNFTPTVQDYTNRVPVNLTNTGCDGTCSAIVKGSGFAVNCSKNSVPFSLIPLSDTGPNGGFDPQQPVVTNGTKIFLSWLGWHFGKPGDISLNVQYKETPDCDGALTIRNCSLRAATVGYSVILDSNKSIINLAPETTIWDDQVIKISDVLLNGGTSGPSTLGGMWLALSNRFTSNANARFAAAVGYEILLTGSTAAEYAQPSANDLSAANSCTLKFGNPLDDMLASARELMFRTAIAAANSSDLQTVSAVQTGQQAVYESHSLYLGLAVLVTALGIIFVAPTFHGYWTLGKTVSMSPIETAKALNAPMLSSIDSNADANTLLREVGDRPIRYGAVTVVHGQALSANSALPRGASNMRLEMFRPDYVTKPQAGWRYT